jgi:hypothetical protein
MCTPVRPLQPSSPFPSCTSPHTPYSAFLLLLRWGGRTTSDGAVYTTTKAQTTTLIPGMTITAAPLNGATSSAVRKSPTTGPIVGAIVGALAVIAVLVLVVVWRMRRGKEGKEVVVEEEGKFDGRSGARFTPFDAYERRQQQQPQASFAPDDPARQSSYFSTSSSSRPPAGLGAYVYPRPQQPDATSPPGYSQPSFVRE